MGKLVILDTNVWLGWKFSSGMVGNLLNDLRKDKPTILLPEFVIKECLRVGKMPREKFLETIKKYKLKVKILPDDDFVSNDAERINKQYDLHYPDNMLVAFAKANGAVLISRDRRLRFAGEMEGVMICGPRQFKKLM